MRHVCISNSIATLILASAVMLGAPGFVPLAPVTVGQNLEVFTGVRLSEAAPATGLEVTVASDDPNRLLLARTPDEAGSKSLVLKVNPRYIETPDFYVHGLGDSGTVTFTVSAPGFQTAKGTVTLVRSAIMIAGPSRAPSFKTTTGMPIRITAFSGTLDEKGNLGMPQPIAGGVSAKVQLSTSNPAVGSFKTSEFTIAGGESFANTEFKPAAAGQAILSAKTPKGFSNPSQFSSVIATVDLPGIGLTGEINLGKDLMVAGTILLGEPAPSGGLDVKLTSSAPKALILSTKEDQVGSGTITIHIPAGDMRAPYYLQALADSGTVDHTATAPGYRTRVAPVFLAPSGFMIVYEPYGPPDEAEVLRTIPTHDPRPFTVSLSDAKPVHVALWPVYLDPKTRRGADITAQRLRPGASATLALSNSNPAVAKLSSSVKISGPSHVATTQFIPLSAGQTIISVGTPPGFAAPSNATSVTATVRE